MLPTDSLVSAFRSCVVAGSIGGRKELLSRSWEVGPDDPILWLPARTYGLPCLALAMLCGTLMLSLSLDAAHAGPSPETARKCLRFSYLIYPYKRPGSVKGTGDRGAFFRDCMAKAGNVPDPAAGKS